MKKGYLSSYFEGIAMKRLSAVEADVSQSNQHEFNGSDGLKALLGEPAEKEQYDARFLYLDDSAEEPIASDGFLTWYDARRKARLERNVMRWEYRLYFPANAASNHATAGDLLLVAKRKDGPLLAIIAKKSSTAEQQLRWLFGVDEVNSENFSVRSELEEARDKIGYAAKLILAQVGIEIEEPTSNQLAQLLDIFGGAFPKTKEFSLHARKGVQVSSRDTPDAALVAWMEHEELLFRTLERHLLEKQLKELQSEPMNTDSYMQLLLSFQQRRKSRAGSALENHLEAIFTENGLTYTRTGVTENGLRPDFIFPGISEYHDPAFQAARLTMVAAKTTCKDRWRQILNEASRIKIKHLLTLEPSISQNQIREMRSEQVQLVLPQELHTTYHASQQSWLMSIADLLKLVAQRQS
jgi:EcoRII C terminal